ncbi:MAG TPA: c-type cytochrome [Ferrovibrio sp.]|uniref:c-type cytochrome n=1 Tax=Ferrovibrio sp. TaxID=1917215 RepID=UPI002ED57A1C
MAAIGVFGGMVSAHAADLQAAKQKAGACAACHGANGVSQKEGTPSLAGQPDQYIQWQLVYFRSGARKSDIMEPIAADLSDADVRNLGAYFASLAPAPAAEAADGDAALSERGAEIAAGSNCANCHRDDFSGQQAMARLAGQREEYLLKALQDFKSGMRRGGGVAAMASAVYPLSQEDLRALAHYLANYR